MEFFFFFSLACLIVGVIFIFKGYFFELDPFKENKWMGAGALLLLLPLVIIIIYIAVGVFMG